MGSAQKVVIVGAGLAGLSAAFELSQAWHEVTLLEAPKQPRGRVCTIPEGFPMGIQSVRNRGVMNQAQKVYPRIFL